MNRIVKFFVSIVVYQSAGVVGSFFTTPAIRTNWYTELKKTYFFPAFVGFCICLGISFFSNGYFALFDLE